MPRPKKSNRSDGHFKIKRVIAVDANGKSISKSFYGSDKAEAARFRFLARGLYFLIFEPTDSASEE